MQLIWHDTRNRFEAISSYHERFACKEARLRWDPKVKRWWTADPLRAAALRGYADPDAEQRIGAALAEREATIAASRAADIDDMKGLGVDWAEREIPAPDGEKYRPFQEAGIAFAASRPATLIGDDMGLGKTIQALGLINADATVERVLIVCPASLRLHWKQQAERWLVRPLSVDVATGTYFPGTNVVVINYDIIHKFHDVIRKREWDLLVVDECHYCKNPKARRTKQVVGYRPRRNEKTKTVEPIRARRKLFLTGTPIENRPVELWPIVNYLDPERWSSFWQFAQTYCGAKNNGWGWDFSGASNLDELQDRLRSTVMIRRKKADVLKELPPKVRQVIEIPANGCTKMVERERTAWQRYQDRAEELRAGVELAKAGTDAEYETAVKALRAGMAAAFEEMARLRHETAIAKLPHVIEHLEAAVETGKVVVFAHHRDVLAKLEEAFRGRSVVVHGGVDKDKRQALVDRFQEDEGTRVFIGQTRAAGVGLTLTAASHVVFAELDWVPGAITQAEDRCHRIGQTDSVLVQHLVLEGSLDALMARRLVAKQDVIDEALDSEHGDTTPAELEVPIMPAAERDEPATGGTRRREIEAKAAELTPENVRAIEEGILSLASMCDGAQKQDGHGFNKMDARLGRSLAMAGRLTPKQAALAQGFIRKYHRQLPAALVAAAGVEPKTAK